MIPWGGISCCFGAAALYVLGRSSNSDADHLRSLPRIDQLKDLAHLLDTACKLPMGVTVSGRVSSDTPITCKHSGIRGVIVEEMAEQHYLKHNESNTWIQDSAVTLFNKKEVPWYLDDGTGRVYVVGARGATAFQLTLASETFEESGRTLMRGTLDYLQGLKMLGVKRIEKVLPTGTSLTVVGEAIIKDDVGKVSIQRPRKGPFYVTAKPIDLLIENVGKWARLYRFASLGFSVLGVCLIAKRAIQYILERRRRLAMQKRILAAVPRLDRDNEDSDEKANALLPALCVICLEQDYNAVFVPCGHMCCCTKCSSLLTRCPLCRRHIDRSMRVYRHWQYMRHYTRN